jgi:hypothetical protein
MTILTMFEPLDLRAFLAFTELGLSQSSVSEHLQRLKRRNSRSNSLFLRDAHSNPGVFARRASRKLVLLEGN